MKLGLRRHGNTHDPRKGSDPIPGIGGSGIQFNEDNEELALRWLKITTNDEIPGDDAGIDITVEDGKDFDIEMDGGGLFRVFGGTGVINKSSSSADFTSSGAIIRAETAGALVRLLGAGTKTFIVADSAGDPIVTYTG